MHEEDRGRAAPDEERLAPRCHDEAGHHRLVGKLPDEDHREDREDDREVHPTFLPFGMTNP